jgi:hypothetical protein
MSTRRKLLLVVLAAAVGWSLSAVIAGEGESLLRAAIGIGCAALFVGILLLQWTATAMFWTGLRFRRRRDRD